MWCFSNLQYKSLRFSGVKPRIQFSPFGSRLVGRKDGKRKMFQYFENLRKKPEGERRRVVLVISLSITLIIAAIWATTLALRIKSTDFSLNGKVSEKDSPGLRETFSNFFQGMKEVIDNGDTIYVASTTVQEGGVFGQ